MNRIDPVDVIPFEPDSIVLTDDTLVQIDAAARWLKRHPSHRIVLEGHADRSGVDIYNEDLANIKHSGPHEVGDEQKALNRQVFNQCRDIMPIDDIHKISDADLIYRFLIARKWNVADVVKNLHEYVEFRQKENLNNVLWEDFPEEVLQLRCKFQGFDKFGHPVFYDCPEPKLIGVLLQKLPREVLLHAHAEHPVRGVVLRDRRLGRLLDAAGEDERLRRALPVLVVVAHDEATDLRGEVVEVVVGRVPVGEGHLHGLGGVLGGARQGLQVLDPGEDVLGAHALADALQAACEVVARAERIVLTLRNRARPADAERPE